ncbi:MAG: N-acetylmuramidase family protein [Cyanobacteria bacterium J06634_5]
MDLSTFYDLGETLDYSEASEDAQLTNVTLVSEIQQALINAGYGSLIKGFSVDGAFGRLSRQALNTFKVDNDLGDPDICDKATVEKLLRFSVNEFSYIYPPIRYGDRDFISTIPVAAKQTALSTQDYKTLAKEFDIEEPAIRAVVEVESAGSGFLIKEPAPARPKILFEAHIFYRETPKPVSKTRPDLSSRKWNKALYKGGSGEWNRLIDAMAFDPAAALRSVSWGLGQVMGFNHKRAGCSTVEQLVVEAHQNEAAQLRHMLNFCKTDGRLIPALKKKDWDTFARGYNGESYKKNNYHKRLAASYAKWKKRLG